MPLESKLESCIKSLQRGEKCRVAHLVYQNFNPSQFQKLIEAIKQNSYLEKLLLNQNHLDPDKAELIASLLLNNNHPLKTLEIPNNSIGDIGTLSLVRALKDNTLLENLNVDDNGISNSGFEALADLIANNKTLKNLSLAKNSYHPQGFQQFGQSFQQNHSIISLNLSFMKLGDQGVTQMANCIQNGVIKTLSLENVQMGHQGAQALTAALCQPNNLQILNIANNFLSDKGAAAIADMLTINKTLTEINLGSNKITDDGAYRLIRALEENPFIIKINLAGNNIHKRLIEEIEALLSRNIRLRSLHKQVESNLEKPHLNTLLTVLLKAIVLARNHFPGYEKRVKQIKNHIGALLIKQNEILAALSIMDESIFHDEQAKHHFARGLLRSSDENQQENELQLALLLLRNCKKSPEKTELIKKAILQKTGVSSSYVAISRDHFRQVLEKTMGLLAAIGTQTPEHQEKLQWMQALIKVHHRLTPHDIALLSRNIFIKQALIDLVGIPQIILIEHLILNAKSVTFIMQQQEKSPIQFKKLIESIDLNNLPPSQPLKTESDEIIQYKINHQASLHCIDAGLRILTTILSEPEQYTASNVHRLKQIYFDNISWLEKSQQCLQYLRTRAASYDAALMKVAQETILLLNPKAECERLSDLNRCLQQQSLVPQMRMW